MKTKSLLPLKKEKEKEIFGGWSNSSGDNWVDPVDVWGNYGDNWIDPVEVWGNQSYYDDSNPYDGWGGEPQDGGGGGSRSDNDNLHSLSKEIEICRQTGTSECSFLAFGALAKYFDIEGLNKDDFAEHTGLFTGTPAQTAFSLLYGDGLTSQEFNSVLDDFFVNTNVNDVNGIIEHLDRGEPIIGTLITDNRDPNNVIGHAIIITGYDSSTNMVTIANSLVDGIVMSMEYSSELLQDLSAVSGAQDNDIVNKYKNDQNDWWKNCLPDGV